MKEQAEIPMVSHVENLSSGITDALTISLALSAGLWFAGFESGDIALACLVVSITIAVVMGAGSYFSRRDHLYDTPEHSLKEWKRTKTLLINLGLTSEQIGIAEQEWLKEQSQPKVVETEPVPISRVVVTTLAFLLGGSVPALCFYLSPESTEGFRISLVVSSISLITFGYIRDKANGLNPWWGAIRAVAIAGAAVLVSIAIANVLLRL